MEIYLGVTTTGAILVDTLATPSRGWALRGAVVSGGRGSQGTLRPRSLQKGSQGTGLEQACLFKLKPNSLEACVPASGWRTHSVYLRKVIASGSMHAVKQHSPWI